MQRSIAELEGKGGHHRRQMENADQQLKMIDELLRLEFSTIDLPSAESDLVRSQTRLQSLLDPDSDAAHAKAEFERESKQLKGIEDHIRGLEKDIAVREDRRKDADEERRKAERRVGRGLSDEELRLAEADMPVPEGVSAKEIGDVERNAQDSIDKKVGKYEGQVTNCEKQLIHLMGKAKQVDTGALVDFGEDIADIPHYLERLRVLNEEALPEKRKRFLEYLNRSSDQGVTQLLVGIEEKIDAIEQRIKDLNATLVRVDYRSGRYLQLQPQRVKHESMRSLEAAQRKVRSAALKDDEGESHYKSLREIVEILREAGGNRRRPCPQFRVTPVLSSIE